MTDRKSPKEEEGEEIIPLRSFIAKSDLKMIVRDAMLEWMQTTDVTQDQLVDRIVDCVRNPIYPPKCEVCGRPFQPNEAKFRNDSCGWRHVRCHV